MISKNVIAIYAGGLRSYARGGRIDAGDGHFAGGPFTAGLIVGGLFTSGLNGAPRIGGAVKRYVWTAVKQRKEIVVNSTCSFVEAAGACHVSLSLK